MEAIALRLEFIAIGLEAIASRFLKAFFPLLYQAPIFLAHDAGRAGQAERHEQQHGTEAASSQSFLSICITTISLLLLVRHLATSSNMYQHSDCAIGSEFSDTITRLLECATYAQVAVNTLHDWFGRWACLSPVTCTGAMCAVRADMVNLTGNLNQLKWFGSKF